MLGQPLQAPGLLSLLALAGGFAPAGTVTSADPLGLLLGALNRRKFV